VEESRVKQADSVAVLPVSPGLALDLVVSMCADSWDRANRDNKETPLNCQEAVAEFKSAVVGVEKVCDSVQLVTTGRCF
jgi:hypothetical protein